MKQNNRKNRIIIFTVVVLFSLFYLGSLSKVREIFNLDDDFVILTNEENREFNNKLLEYAKSNKIDVSFEYADDLEIVERLSLDSNKYDAVWMSNSTWLYMTKARTSNSKSTNINPVVFGIKKSKAESLGFTKNEVYNKDIVNAIKNGKLKYVMTSVTKTNTGLVSYLGFLNALSGSPDVLTSEMIHKTSLINDLKTLFSGVQRVSGSDDFLNEMFLRSDEYEAVVATESALIEINKELVSRGKEPLYLIYPVDGVSVNDSPFAYVDNGQERLEEFSKLQSFMLSKETQMELEKMGRRTWYGGINNSPDSESFKKEWGIDTSKYLTPLNYPSKAIIDEAIDIYLNELRKPSATAFCLDFSGSMFGDGEVELKSAMEYILDYEQAKVSQIQFSSKDKIFVIPFSDYNYTTLSTNNGKKTEELINNINDLETGGGTNLYGCVTTAIEELREVSKDYTKTIILMTDGQANRGSYYDVERLFSEGEKMPIYGIMFGSARESELNKLAILSNARVFDGRTNLTEAFKEVRSYN